MHDQWYYGRGSDITGPVTGQELFDLANLGTIVVTDMIWENEDEQGVAAGKIVNLFPVSLAIDDPAISTSAVTEAVEAPITITPEVKPPVELAYPKPVEKKARATAGKGAVIVGQDGKTVKYRMKCTVCNFEDSSWKSIAIPRGTQRANFYCPKCRKKRDVEIHGFW